MCGRLVQELHPEGSLQTNLNVLLIRQVQEEERRSRYNLAPTQHLWAVNGQWEWVRLRWGFPPSWKPNGPPLINAKAETVTTLRTFSEAFRSRRCLVPVTAFYEWRGKGDTKQPFAIREVNGQALLLAALWEPGEPDGYCTVLTTTANVAMEPVHSRMPVVLTEEGAERWLAGEAKAEELCGLLRPCPSESLRVYPVSKAVGNWRNDGPELLDPVVAFA
jgi:putative SOS response-associated peptidase YedK